MLIAIYTKGIQVNKSIINDIEYFKEWCKQFKPKEVWVLDTEKSEIKYHFTVEIEVTIKDIE